MGNFTPGQFWTLVLAAASAIVLLANAAEKIGKAIHAAKAPNNRQNDRLDDLEKRMDAAEKKLDNDNCNINSDEFFKIYSYAFN